MSPSSLESELAQLREALLQLNSEFFLTIAERRGLTVKIQGLKASGGRYGHFDPEREKEIFTQFLPQLKALSIRELLAFSLVMEDHAMAMAPGSYPTWSLGAHLADPREELYEMVNPLLLKLARSELFQRLLLNPEFSFLNDF
jgi:chorismate mutase